LNGAGGSVVDFVEVAFDVIMGKSNVIAYLGLNKTK